MRVTKTTEAGKWELVYRQYVDWSGILSDIYEVSFSIKGSKKKTAFPCLVPLKVKDYGPETNIMDSTNKPTKEEMQKYLGEKIQELEDYYDLSVYPAVKK